MRALGASRAQVLSAQRAEFAVLGAIAGALGSLGATAIGWTLATRVFELEFVWNGWIWLAGRRWGSPASSSTPGRGRARRSAGRPRGIARECLSTMRHG